MNKNIKSGLIQGIVGASTMLLIGITYASTVSSGQLLTADLFNEKMVPSKAVMAFNSDICPTGWKVADGTNGTQDLQNEFIRGAVPGGGREVGHTEDASAVPSHFPYSTWPSDMVDNNEIGGYTKKSSYAFQSLGADTTKDVSMQKVRPQNVALLFCEKE